MMFFIRRRLKLILPKLDGGEFQQQILKVKKSLEPPSLSVNVYAIKSEIIINIAQRTKKSIALSRYLYPLELSRKKYLKTKVENIKQRRIKISIFLLLC